MRYYRNAPGQRKDQIMSRILFVIIVAAVVTFGAIFLGNYLQNKVNKQNELESVPARKDTEVDEKEDFLSEKSRQTSTKTSATSIDISTLEKDTDIKNLIGTISDSFNTVNLPLSDIDGKLKYSSPALSEIVMQKYDSTMGYDLICEIVKTAHSMSYRTSAYVKISLDDEEIVTKTLISEIISIGFDEILIDFGIKDGYFLGEENAKRMILSLNRFFALSGGKTEIGILLPMTIISESVYAKQVQMLAHSTSFIAIRYNSTITNYGLLYSEYYYDIQEIEGIFGVYNLRFFVPTAENDIISAHYNAIKAAKLDDNIIFEAFVGDDEMNYSDEIRDEQKEAEKKERETQSNPYALGTSNSTVTPEIEEKETESTQDSSEEDHGEEETPRRWY